VTLGEQSQATLGDVDIPGLVCGATLAHPLKVPGRTGMMWWVRRHAVADGRAKLCNNLYDLLSW